MKKLLKKIFVCAVCCMMLFAAFGCGGGAAVNPPNGGGTEQPPSGNQTENPPDEEKQVDFSTYQSFWMKQADYKTMPVAAFNAFATVNGAYYTKDMYSDEHVKAMAEAGINVAYSRETVNDSAYLQIVKQELESCRKYGISYMASVGGGDSYSNANILEAAVYNALIEGKPEALGGIMVKDEPNKTHYEPIKKSIATFKEVFAQKRYNGLLYHVSLFPTYSSDEQRFGKSGTEYSYEQYVDDFLETVNPSILSYDNYPCLNEKPNISGDYFENMSIIRRKAAAKGIPFWVYIQSCTYGGRDRVPNQEDNDWQVNTALAYGSKGIQYFCYVTPGLGGEDVFADGCIDWNGNKTATYDIVKETNKQIAAVDEVLMCSLSKGVMTAGETPCPIPEQDILESCGALKTLGGAHALAGCFDYDGQDAYYVVNNNVSENDEITLTLDKAYSGYYVADGKKTEFSDKNGLTFAINAGKGVLVVLNK